MQNKRMAISLASIAMLPGLTLPVAADTFTWINPSGGAFTAAGNWNPAVGPPGSSDDIVFNLADTYTVNLTGLTHTVEDVTVRDGSVTISSPSTNFLFSMNGLLDVGSPTNTPSLSLVGNFQVNALGGLALGSGGTVSVSNSSRLGVLGTGTVATDANMNLNNSGTLVIGNDSTFTIDQPSFDWDGDGSENTTTTVGINSTLTINSPTIDSGGDSFDANLIVNGGSVRVLNTANEWSMQGMLTMNGSDETARIAVAGPASQSLNLRGTLEVAAGVGRVEPTLLAETATINVNNGATLELASTADFQDTAVINLNDAGRLTFHDDAHIRQPTFSWGSGAEAETVTTIHSGATLSITSEQIGASDIVGGTININDSELYIDNEADQWTMAGTINISNTGRIGSVSSGPGEPLTVTGEINATGNVDIDPPLTLNGATVNVDADSRLLLKTGTTFTGDLSTLSGEGTITHEADFTVDGPVSVSTAFYNIGGAFNDNSITLNDSLMLEVQRITLATAVTESFDGTLNINTGTLGIDNAADQWLFTGTATLASEDNTPSISGDTLNAEGAMFDVTTQGRVTADLTTIGTVIDVNDGATLTLDGATVISADSTLDLNNTGHLVVGGNTTIQQPNFDWDGRDMPTAITTVTAGGSLTIESDQINVVDDQFESVVNLNGGNVTIDVMSDQWFMRGTLNFDSTTGTPSVAGDPVILAGTINVSGPTAPTFSAHTTYTSLTNLVFAPDTPISIDHTGPFTIEPGATFPEGFTIGSSAPKTLADGSTSPFPLSPSDQLHIGSEPATATVPGLHLTGTSTLNIQLDTPVPTSTPPVPGVDHDLVTVTTEVTLGGTIHMDFLDRHDELPEIGTEYVVMTYGGRISGTSFARATGVLLNTSLALLPMITDTDGDLIDDAVVLRVSIPGDLNLDNAVTIADLSTLALNFNTVAPNDALYDDDTALHSWELGDFNGDGSITISDLSLLALNFGFSLSEDGSVTPASGISIEAAARFAGVDFLSPTGQPESVPEPHSILVIGLGIIVRAGTKRLAH